MSTPEAARLKQAVAWMWSLGDYSAISPLLEPSAVSLAGMCGIRPGMRVLDVAAGNGNFALAAARSGAEVTACDLTPRMIELGRARTDAAGVDVEWREGDAEALLFAAASFDVVASVFGAMFAPDVDRVAAELFRVCVSGGTVAMTSYAAGGFLGAYSGVLAGYSGPPPAAMPSPFEWGDRETVAARFAGRYRALEFRSEPLAMSFASVEDGFSLWERTNAPTVALRTLLPADRYREFAREAVGLMRRLNEADDGSLRLTSPSLHAVAGSR